MRKFCMLAVCAAVVGGCAGDVVEEERLAGDAEALTVVPTEPHALDAEEAEFLRLLNEYRASQGKGVLTARPVLNAVALAHSRDLAESGTFSHDSSDGRSPWQRLDYANYSGGYRGENIAAGNSAASATFTQWKNSPGHNENMLNANFRDIGIGRFCLDSAVYRCYWTTDFGSLGRDGALPTPPVEPPVEPPADGADGDDAACAPESEPNDTYGAANPLAATACGTLASAQDVDRFSWTSSAAGVPFVVEATGGAVLFVRRYVGTSSRYYPLNRDAQARVQGTTEANTRYQVLVVPAAGAAVPTEYQVTLDE